MQVSQTSRFISFFKKSHLNIVTFKIYFVLLIRIIKISKLNLGADFCKNNFYSEYLKHSNYLTFIKINLNHGES